MFSFEFPERLGRDSECQKGAHVQKRHTFLADKLIALTTMSEVYVHRAKVQVLVISAYLLQKAERLTEYIVLKESARALARASSSACRVTMIIFISFGPLKGCKPSSDQYRKEAPES